MRVYLLRYGVYGIKNIVKSIELNFYKKGVDKNFDPSDYKIKAIYGENGSGKTAIITSVNILKKLMLYQSYLVDPKTQELLNHIVNKEKNEFRIYAEFCINSESAPLVLYYDITVGREDGNEQFVIKREVLKYKKASYVKAPYHDVYEVENGSFTKLFVIEGLEEIIVKKTMNLLKQSSAATRLMDDVIKDIENKKDFAFIASVLLLQYAALSMNAVLNDEDEHSLYYTKKSIEKLREVKDITDEYIDKALYQMNEIVSLQTNRVMKNSISAYEERISKLTGFIQRFKPDLEGIRIEKKDLDATYYQIALIFDYGSYCVDYEFESTGIKKMVQIFDAIMSVVKGGIVFIDEFDANINSIYFDKLIEYVRDYTDGQLCFTVHNTSAMEPLKEGKDSINFLTYENKIVKWTKNGHYSPDVLYRNGMIDGIPFNIYGSDFVGIFEGDNE